MRLLPQRRKSNLSRRPAETAQSQKVFSYYARGNSPSTQNTGRRDEARLQQSSRKKYHLRLGHTPSYIAAIVLIGSVLYSCTLQPTPKVVLVSGPNTIHQDAKVYQDALQSIWKKSLLNRTKLTVATSKIQSDLQAQFGELSHVSIELPLLGRRPTVVLTPGTPSLQLVTANGSFYIDSEGKVMARTTEITQNQLNELPVIQDETGSSAEVGKRSIPGSEVAYLSSLFTYLKAENVAVQSITLPSGAANEADLHVVNQGYIVKFSIDTDPRQGVGSYLAAKSKLDGDHITPSEYMDIRVEEKVFYK